MEVYIEYVIIDNLIINILLLLCTLKTFGMRYMFFRVFLASLFGTTMVCLFPLIKIPAVLLVLYRIAVGVIMIMIAFHFKTFKQLLFAFGLLVLYTFLMGGACMVMIKLLGGNPEHFTIGEYDTIIPVSIIIMIVFVYAFIIFRLTKYIYRRKDMMPFMQHAEIEICGKKLALNAYVDSGNRLYDKKTGAPIIVLSAFALEKVFGKDDIASLVFGEKNTIFKNIHYVTYSTVEGVTKKMVVFVADKLVLSGSLGIRIFENVSVGVTFKKFNDAINFDLLLHPSLLS